jgi:hypothetical protein
MAGRKCQHCNYPYIKDNYCPNCGSDTPQQGCISQILSGIVGFIILIVIIKSCG